MMARAVPFAPFGPMIVVALSLGACGPSSKELAALKARSDHLVEGLKQQNEAFRLTAAQTLSRIPSGTCSPSMLERDSSGVNNYAEVLQTELGSAEISALTRVRTRQEFFADYLDGRTKIKTEGYENLRRELANTERELAAHRYEIVLVVGSLRPPVLQPSGLSYTAGALEGRGLVWDVKEDRVICSAEVSVASASLTNTAKGYEQTQLNQSLVYSAREKAFALLGLGDIRGFDLGPPQVGTY